MPHPVLQPPTHNAGRLSRVQSLGSSRFVRHYYGNCFFSSGYLDVSVPPLASYLSRSLSITREGLPHSDIHGSACKRLPVAFRSVATSFVGPSCQGIHHTPFLACRYLYLAPLLCTHVPQSGTAEFDKTFAAHNRSFFFLAKLNSLHRSKALVSASMMLCC